MRLSRFIDNETAEARSLERDETVAVCWSASTPASRDVERRDRDGLTRDTTGREEMSRSTTARYALPSGRDCSRNLKRYIFLRTSFCFDAASSPVC
jgi:hypothetical protein